ncbi:GspH/FimT family protein [Fastidiosibacter lacustris]|uniref:GspH/FimT family protein n=1 Tax=Fastidiosibacter lacustris TaxID=2056695 RepID=UPI000E357AB9|nr:GspH/FimT family protein [Fastidiosibacter lacustris]
MKHKKKNKNFGFSLIEGLVVIILIGIIVTIAIPMSIGSFGRAHSEMYLDRVRAALELGRITAMSESMSIFLCPTSNGTNCNTTVPANNWGANRLLLFTSSSGEITTVTRIVSILEAPGAGDYLSSNKSNRIEIQPNGLTSTALRLYYCSIVDDQGANRYTRELIINFVGRVNLNILPTAQNC